MQSVHFPLTDALAATFKRPDTRIVVGTSHPAYAHMTELSEEVRAELAADLD
ncbi:MAG: DUF3501 family protein [Alphaproteobacteria bacterium]